MRIAGYRRLALGLIGVRLLVAAFLVAFVGAALSVGRHRDAPLHGLRRLFTHVRIAIVTGGCPARLCELAREACSREALLLTVPKDFRRWTRYTVTAVGVFYLGNGVWALAVR